MKQTCLCKYLGVPCNHPDTLLRIPLSIRQRIYLYAGLITESFLPYPNFGWVDGDDKNGIPREDYHTTFDLTEVCIQMRHEVEAMIFSRNVCVYKGDEVDLGIEFLSGMIPRTCAVLRDVYVQLYIEEEYVRREPLSWKRVEMWQWAATNILTSATPRQLKLHLTCETESKAKTDAVLQPLVDHPGVLLELELRLHQKSTIKVRELALQILQYDLTPTPFRFFDLPAEIRQHIFEYTDLVTPYRKVHWNPNGGFRAEFIFCECDGTVCLEEDLHAGREHTHCGASSRLTGSFCSRYYNSYSSRCNHTFSIVSLLLTNRDMYNEAISFFYAKNRVMILPDWTPQRTIFAGKAADLPAYEPGAMEQSNGTEQNDVLMQDQFDLSPYTWEDYIARDTTKLFFEKVGPRALRLIRTLEIVFPRIGPDSSLSDRAPAYKEWCMAVDSLANVAANTTVPNLTLIVHVWRTPVRTFVGQHQLEDASGETEEKAHRLLKVLQPLSQLQLKRLFVHLDWPRHWSPPKLLNDIKNSKIPRRDSPGCGIGDHWIPSSDKYLAEKEIQLEKMVMGAEYDSSSVGKGYELPSQWLRNPWDCGM
ncbi:hypothetical protein FQN54_002402 [Arachnomyces sp. PD_36]|nr:hypothetical protein FQN54_002402 [Arachnomyces sp. PD_36]